MEVKDLQLHYNTALQAFSRVNQKLMFPRLSMERFPDHQRALILELLTRDDHIMVTLLKYWQHVPALRIRQIYFEKGRTEKERINCHFLIQGNEHRNGLQFLGEKKKQKNTEDCKHICLTNTAGMLISSISLWESSSRTLLHPTALFLLCLPCSPFYQKM